MQILTANQALAPEGWQADVEIRIADDGRIAQLGPMTARAAQHHDMLLPAPVNLHSHAFQRAMAGLTEARSPDPTDSFWTWRRQMYRFLDHLDPDHVEAIAALVFMEMLEAGYGAVAEFHYLHHGPQGQPHDDLAEMSARILAAAQTTGIGLTLLPVLYQRGGCDGRALQGGQLRFGNDPGRFARLHAAAARLLADHAHADDRIGVAPHSLRAVDANGLDAARALAGDGPLHMHLAEQAAEVAEVEAHTGARPVTWLLDRHDIGARWCLVHCTQMTPEETVRLAATGAVAGLCPITEANLGDGIFDGVRYLAAGGAPGPVRTPTSMSRFSTSCARSNTPNACATAAAPRSPRPTPRPGGGSTRWPARAARRQAGARPGGSKRGPGPISSRSRQAMNGFVTARAIPRSTPPYSAATGRAASPMSGAPVGTWCRRDATSAGTQYARGSERQ